MFSFRICLVTCYTSVSETHTWFVFIKYNTKQTTIIITQFLNTFLLAFTVPGLSMCVCQCTLVYLRDNTHNNFSINLPLFRFLCRLLFKKIQEKKAKLYRNCHFFNPSTILLLLHCRCRTRMYGTCLVLSHIISGSTLDYMWISFITSNVHCLLCGDMDGLSHILTIHM